MKITDELHRHLVEWLKANNIDPNNVPADTSMTLDGNQLTTEVHMLDADGHKMMTPAGNGLATKLATHTISVEPPPDVAWWLRDRCPTCGR